MCGIFVGKRGVYKGQMKHRGIVTRKDNFRGLDLVHEHLPIQSTTSYNPIIRKDGKIILFNGELFIDNVDNDLEWIKDLFSFLDTDEAIHEIKTQDGFYSFIVCHNDSIWAFTDPLGKKQLYYCEQGIASELRPFRDRNHDHTTLTNIMKFGYNYDDRTVYEGVRRIEPNCLYEFDINFNIKSIKKDIYKFKPKEGDLYQLIDKAVNNRLKGHHQVGLLLSGGLDSSIIHHHIKTSVSTYCVDNQYDLQFAQLMDPNVTPVQLSMKPGALSAMEMPIDLGSMYPQYDLFSKVNETVILTGDGADEVFGGYRRMNDYDSQYSDIFCELPYYHNIRLDRMSMIQTKEVRSPFMSLKVIEHGLSLPYEQRVNKRVLRETYNTILPDEIISRGKEPLKINNIRENELQYRKGLINEFTKQH